MNNTPMGVRDGGSLTGGAGVVMTNDAEKQPRWQQAVLGVSMSTVAPTAVDDPGQRIASLDDLVTVFSSAEKPRSAYRVGTEHEKFGFVGALHAPLPFDGPQGIEAILHAIASDTANGTSWVAATDGGRTIALFGNNASITLEPGGQLELSGAPLRTVHETYAEVSKHMELLRKVCVPRQVGFIGMGFHPTARYAELPLVPKNRYGIMQRYMPTVGARGLDMMKRTATVQANYDWHSEADLRASYQMSLRVSPLVAALFANSPFVEGKPSGSLSERQRVWADTDSARGGYPDVVLRNDFSYETYLQWVLDVPMYFVRRDGMHHDVAGASFRTFARSGLVIDGERVFATERDFADHLTTIFPEVRLKRVLEVRSADCGRWSHVCALPALYKGLLYDDKARDEAHALMQDATSAELQSLRADVAVRGYRAVFRGQPILGLCERLLDAAGGGLDRLNDRCGSSNKTERCFLEPLVDSVSRGQTFAEQLLELYHGAWQGSLEPLWREAEFWPDAADRIGLC
jgi:glutamate--cysteine ligase